MASDKLRNAMQTSTAHLPQQKQSGQVQIQQQSKMTILDLIQKQKPAFQMALGKNLDPDRFTRIALTIVRQSKELMMSTTESLLGALMNSAQLGLEPNVLGQAYIIPRRNKQGQWEANFQIGYKGLLTLFYNSEQAQSIYAKEVYSNDEFDYEFGLDLVLKHKPAKSNRGEVTHFYAVAKMKNGAFAFEVMSLEDITKHAQAYSKTFTSKYSPWKSNFVEMAKKTVLIRVLKTLPLRTEIARQFAQDDTIKHYKPETKDMSETIDVTDFSIDDIDENEINSQVAEIINQETGEITQN